MKLSSFCAHAEAAQQPLCDNCAAQGQCGLNLTYLPMRSRADRRTSGSWHAEMARRDDCSKFQDDARRSHMMLSKQEL